jgi:uncharacterized SAM-binding protein YcdF (DUF218 family)
MRTRSRWLLRLAVLAVLTGLAAAGLGRFLTREPPLRKADAIYVLGGSWTQRWLEAVDLYREGFAPHIVISRGSTNSAEEELAARGIRLPGPADLARDAMVTHLGVPADAVEVLARDVDNTAQEAAAIQHVAAERHWRSIIVITDRASTRRAGYAMQRVLGNGVEVIVHAPRRDPFQPGRWWATREDFRAVFYEAPKLLAYYLGLRE